MLGTVTLDRYRSDLGSVGVRHLGDGARSAVAALGGPHSPTGLAAHSSGLDLAMLVGALITVLAAVVAFVALPSARRSPRSPGLAATGTRSLAEPEPVRVR